MSYKKVRQANKKTKGTKRTAKAIYNGNVTELIIASDDIDLLVRELSERAIYHNVPIS